MTGSDRTIKRSLLIVTAICLLTAIGLFPPLLAWLTTVDGRIDNPVVLITLWIISLTLVALGVGTSIGANHVTWVRWLAARLWAWRWQITATAGLVICLIGIALAAHARARNHIDLLARLNPDHPLYARVQGVASTNGEKAALDLIADYFTHRTNHAPINPNQWYTDWFTNSVKSQRRTQKLLQGDLGSACCDRPYYWRPGESIDWSDPALSDLLFSLQGQTFLLDLLAAQDGIPNRRQVDIAKAFVEEWRRANRVWPNFNPYAWNDDAMSDRIQAHMVLMEVLRAQGLSTRSDELAFLRSLLQHADRLMDESEHNFQTNHGIRQNNALLSIALAYPEFDQRGQWRQTAIKWMKRHLRESVDPEGVFLELTPGYHWNTMIKIMWFVAACRQAQIELDLFFETTLRKMLVFSREILNPDRSLPMISDTWPEHIAIIPETIWKNLPDWPELSALRQALSLVDQPPNKPTARLWPHSGYFILRAPAPDWTLDSGMMLTFITGPRSRAHPHHDKLSVTLFGHGQPLLTGPGYPPYEDAANRAQLLATTSQNTVSVDGLSQRLGDAKVLFYDVRPADLSNSQHPDFVAIQGESLLYDGVTHHRTVFYGPALGTVLIVDELASKDEHTYRQHFRAAPALEIKPDQGSLWIFDPRKANQPLLRVDAWTQVGRSITRPALSVSEQVGTFAINGRDSTYVTLLDLSAAFNPKTLTVGDKSIIWRGPLGTLTINPPITSPQAYHWASTE